MENYDTETLLKALEICSSWSEEDCDSARYDFCINCSHTDCPSCRYSVSLKKAELIVRAEKLLGKQKGK